MFALRASSSLTNALATAGRHSSAPSHLTHNLLSPLTLVAQELMCQSYTIPDTSGVAQSVLGVLQRNGFQTTAVLLGGRRSNFKPEKGSSWRGNLSKKAQKRLKRQKETTSRRAKSMPQLLSDRQSKQTSALAIAQDKAASLLPSKMELQLQSENNRTVIESVTMPESFPETRAESLLRIDPVAYRSSVDAAMAACTPSARTGQGMAKRWNTYLRILAAHGKLVEATQAYKDMRQAGLRATEYTLCALLTACAQERNVSAARAVWSSLTGGLPVPGVGENKGADGTEQREGMSGHVMPSSACYGALIQCHVRAEDLTGAFAVLAAAEQAGIAMNEPTLWTHLIAGCSHAGQYERAIETFEHMRTFHCRPDVAAYTTLIGVYGRLDEVEKVLDLVTEMKQLGPQPNALTYNAAINAAGRSTRRFQHAHEMFWEMDALGFARDVRSYQGVLLACSHHGEVARAREYMAHMTGRGIKPDRICFNTLLTVYARALRDTSLKPGSGRKLISKVSAEDVAVSQASGVNLPALDAQGALSRDPDAVKDAELMNENRLEKAVSARSRELRHGHARRVLGPVDDVVDAMLADYFGSSSQRQAEEEKELEPFEKGASPESEAFAGPDSEEVLDVQDPAWLKLRSALTASGVVDESLMEDLEMEYGQRHAENEVEEVDRARYYEKRHKERMAAMEDELLDIAGEEAGMRGDKQGAATARAVRDMEGGQPAGAYDSSSASEDEFTEGEEGSDDDVIDVKAEGSGSGPSTTGMRGLFADVAQRVEQVTGKPLGAVPGKGRGAVQLTEREEEQTSSELILAAARSGGRIPMREYLAALEREVMEGSFGPQWEYETADEGEAVMTMQAKARARGLAAREQALEEEALRAELGLPRVVAATIEGQAMGAPPTTTDTTTSTSDPSLQILDVANVPQSATERHPVAIRGPDGQIRVLRRRWLSMFGRVGEDEEDDVAMLGGVRLKDLFNVNTIPLPPQWKSTIERGALREDVDFEALEDLDPADLYEHTEAVLRARIHAALIREAMGVTGPVAASSSLLQKQAKRLVEAMSVEKDLFNDPLLSDNAEEYAALAGVTLPDMGKVRREMAQLQGVEDARGVQDMQIPEVDDTDVEGERDEEEDAVHRLREAAAHTLEAIGGYEGAQGKSAKGKKKGQGTTAEVQGSTATEASPVSIPREGEEILLSAMSATSPTLPSSPEARAMAEDPDGFSPAQRAHRAFTARVLGRILAVHPIGPVERLLVEASESADKSRQRRHNQQEPTLLDALFAVQRLKQQAVEGSGTRHVKADVRPAAAAQAGGSQASHTGPSSSVSASVGVTTGSAPGAAGAVQPAGGYASKQDSLAVQGGWVESPLDVAMQQAEDASEVVRKSPLVAAMVQARQEARQAEAKQLLAKGAQEDEGHSARLKAVVQLSNTVMAGAAWLPSTPYPLDRGEKRQQLLMELSRIYRREFPAQGLTPDQVTLNVMINAYAAAGDSSSAYAFLHDQFPAAGVRPDVRTFRALMRMHVRRKEDERAVELLRAMPSLGVQPDSDCYGLVVHARAREWRVKEAITLVQEAKSRGTKIPEEYAKLLRQRCKSMGIFHPDVPAHPIGWQFSPEVMKKRFAGAKSKESRRQSSFLKPVMNKMR